MNNQLLDNHLINDVLIKLIEKTQMNSINGTKIVLSS